MILSIKVALFKILAFWGWIHLLVTNLLFHHFRQLGVAKGVLI